MASMEKMMELVKDLTSDVNIPGLDVDTVVPNLVETTYKQELDTITDSKVREEEKKKMIEYYKTAGRMEVETQISTIKMSYKHVKEQIKHVTSGIATVAVNAVMPPTVNLLALPNPAKVLLDNIGKVGGWLSMIESALAKFGEMLLAAVKIAFEIPDFIIQLLSILVDLKKTVTAIPVPKL